ncbi:MAG: hypothetical protein H3C26_12350 [Rhodocyclaceae bacterium]|nr:hypothetical protein [Rhodocyclaceae bacterium]
MMDCADLAADIALATSEAVVVSMETTTYAFALVLGLALACGFLTGLWLSRPPRNG